MTVGVSVVICAYTEDRWELLSRSVESVLEQDGHASPQIVLVIDHNESLTARCQRAWPAISVVPNQHERGLSGARNTGVESSCGDIVAFLDDDAAAHPGWLAALVAAFADETVGLVGGTIEPDWALGQPAWFPNEFRWVVGCSYRGMPTEAADIRNPIGASMAVRRRTLDDVGLFTDGIGRIGNTPLGCEETELAIRAATHGFRSRSAPDSVVQHWVGPERHTFRYFVRRCWSEGVSKAAVARLTTNNAALSTERSYVLRTIPSGVWRAVRRTIVGPRRGGPSEAGALITGTFVTAAAYGSAAVRLRRAAGS
jgi:GT2 family glycosyltransferase